MKLRKIIVNNRLYLWKREHIHLPKYEISPCLEKITIFLDGNKKSPLRLFFKEDDNKMRKENFEIEKWCLNGNGDGVVWMHKQSSLPANNLISVNFNKPSVIKNIIVYFLDRGWIPENNIRPLEVNDALKCLDSIDWEIDEKA